MKQTYKIVIGSLFLLVCTTGVVGAEGETPATPPAPPETTLPETIAPETTLTNTLSASARAVGPKSAALSDDDAPVEAAKPVLESWRPIVDSLRPSYWNASVLPVQGLAMYYNPGVFQRVLDFRYEYNHINECAECIGYVALLRAGDIDRRVWLQRTGRMAGPIPITVYAAESSEGQAFAAAYFSSEMIPLDERYFIPPEANNYRTEKIEIETAADSQQMSQPAQQNFLSPAGKAVLSAIVTGITNNAYGERRSD